MRKRAHHRELQLSNYHVCNFQFKLITVEVAFWRFSSECKATRFLQRNFSSFVYSLLVCFRRVTLEQMSDNNQSDYNMVNMSNRSVSCRKITLKVGKSFCRGNFSLYPADNFFGQGSEEMSKEYACKVSRLCRFCTWSFSQSKITQRWWTDILLPRSLSLAALLRITCCCYGFMSCPRDSMAIQLLAGQKVGHLSLSSQCGPVHDGDVDVHVGRNPCFSRQKLLWQHFSRSLSMWFFSFLSWAHKRKNSVSFKTKSIFNPFSTHMWKNESIRRTGSYEKKWQNFYFW